MTQNTSQNSNRLTILAIVIGAAVSIPFVFVTGSLLVFLCGIAAAVTVVLIIPRQGRSNSTKVDFSELDELLHCVECDEPSTGNQVMDTLVRIVRHMEHALKEIAPLSQKLENSSQELVFRNRAQVEKVQETVFVANSMSTSFTTMLVEVEESLKRAGRQAEISADLTTSSQDVTSRIDGYLNSVHDTSEAIEEVAAGLELTNSHMNELAKSTEKTTSSAAEISASISQVKEFAHKTFEFSELVQKEAVAGLKSINQLTDGMRKIEESSDESIAAIDRLTSHTDQIDTILTVITEIVEHTKLLSLNASIIAAQAGSRGASFAVVASEVRELANRTSSSTDEISDLVANIKKETAEVDRILQQGRDNVSAGVHFSEDTDQVFHRIEKGALEAASMVRKIADATSEQAGSAGLIARETEGNFGRVQQVCDAVDAQRQKIDTIVSTLEQMKSVSGAIKGAIENQMNMNDLFLETVNENYQKSEELRGSAMQMLEVGDQVLCFILEAGKLIESNADKATIIVQDIAHISGMNNKLIGEIKNIKTSNGNGNNGEGIHKTEFAPVPEPEVAVVDTESTEPSSDEKRDF